MTIIRDIRLNRGADPTHLADVLGITLRSYYDLESYDDELYSALSIQQITLLARELAITPSTLFDGDSSGPVSLETLAAIMQRYLAQPGHSLADLEEQAGWDLTEAMQTPRAFLSFNAYGLRDACAAVGVNWLCVLDGLDSDEPQAMTQR